MGHLGRAGMASVLETRDRVTGGRVAIRLRRSAFGSEELKRFIREREITASLDRARILRIHSCGVTADERPFMVLECLDS